MSVICAVESSENFYSMKDALEVIAEQLDVAPDGSVTGTLSGTHCAEIAKEALEKVRFKGAQ